MRIKTALGMTTFALLPFLMAACSDSNPTSFTINATGGLGGSATGGAGGNGNYFEGDKYSGDGDLEVLKTGSADASFKVVTPSGNLGDNPLEITADTTIQLDPTSPAAGVVYMVTNDTNVYISDGDATLQDEPPVTGISVASGKKLTLALNSNGVTQAHIVLQNDFVNKGTLTTADASATQRGNLQLDVDTFVGTRGSIINTYGTADGQSGGYVDIWADWSAYNHGTVNAYGADSAAGNAGAGGYFDFEGGYNSQNTGKVNTYGGDAPAGAGGNAGYVYLYAGWGSAHNSGTWTANGGDGVTGGSGDWLELYAYGDSINSGRMIGQGGDATGGNAGNGASLDMYAWGGKIVNNANIDLYGGSTTNAASNAGDGNDAYFENSDYNFVDGNTPAGDILISGNFNTSGGDAVATGTGIGGDGGYVYAYCNGYGIPGTNRVAFLGYSSIDTSGGDGNTGGYGYGFWFYNQDTYDYLANNWVPGGNILVEATLISRGGDGVAANATSSAWGGDGGDFYAYSTYTDGASQYPEKSHVTFTANIDLSGGASQKNTSNGDGMGGYMDIWGYNGVKVDGNIVANAGDAVDTDGGTDGYGGDTDTIYVYAETGSVSVKSLSASGGDGEYAAGDANSIYIYGASVSMGSLNASGGNATATLTGSTGGDGAWIELWSPFADVTKTGTTNYAGGTGATEGVNGSFINNAVCVGTC